MNLRPNNWSHAWLLLIVLFLPAATQAQLLYTNTYGLWGYIINDATIIITGYTGSNTVIFVPTTVNNLPVTSIGESAFFSESGAGLTRVIIPNSVTNIGSMAFRGCTSLVNVTMADGLIDIGDTAFFGCTNLNNVTIPNSVTRIGNDAFDSCTRLTKLTIGTNVTSIEAFAFNGCVGLTKVTIPPAVTNLSLAAFTFCFNLTNISVDPLNRAYSSADGVVFDKDQKTLFLWPEGKTGNYAVPDTVATIGNGAFSSCTGLSQVIIPDTVNNIGVGAFSGCTNLASVIMGSGVTNIGGSAFSACYSLTNLTIGDGVAVIGRAAFQRCLGLTNLSIGNSVKLINEAAFQDCSGLASVTIGNGVTNIGNSAFLGCIGLTNVVVGSSVASIGRYAFDYCSNLSIHFEGNAPSLPTGTNIFQGDFYLTVFYLPGTLGWGSTFAGFPTAVWRLPYPLILSDSIGLGNNQQFGFTVSWASNATVVVESSTEITGSKWLPVTTNPIVSGWFLFSDPETTNSPARFYRLRSL